MTKDAVKKILTPSQKYADIMGIVVKAASVCGFFYLALNTFNIINGLRAGDIFIPLQALCYSGVGVQGLTKMLSALGNVDVFQLIHAELLEIYSTHERKNEKYCQCLHDGLSKSKKLIVALVWIYVLTTLLMLFAPLGYAIYFGEHITLMEFKVPGLDVETQFGYISLTCVHVVCILFGMFGNFSSDAFLFLIVSQIPMIKNLMKCKLNDLDDVVTDFPRDTSKSGRHIKTIIQWHLKYMDISGVLKKIYFWVIFAQTATSFTSIVCSIICLLFSSFPSGPSYLVYVFIILFSYCALGNLVEISNDDVTTMVYDCKWYELTVSEQKMVLIMLRQSQQAVGMSIGGIMDLTMNAGLQIIKTIYSITMMLHKSFG